MKVTKVCKVCDVTLDKPGDFAKHQHCVLFSCGKCQFRTKTVESFNEHVKSHQMKYAEQKCTMCQEIFSSPITHAVHKRKIHGLYDCRHCSEEFPSKTDWSNHMKYNHKDKVKKKPNLTQSSNEDLSFNKKLLVHSVPMLVPTQPAQFIMSSSESINTICTANIQSSSVAYNPQLYSHGNHTRKQSLTFVDEERITCKDEPLETENVTPETFLVKVKPQPRRRNILPPKLIGLPCESCPSVFKTLTALRVHVKQKHTARPKCPACNVTRSTSRKVFQHQITAHKEKLRCRHYCLALFDTREELSAHHISVHNKDDTVMKCRYCRTNYAKGTYLEHLQNCPGEIKCKRIKRCTACDKKFVDPTEYSHHVKKCKSSSAKNDSERGSPAMSTSAVKKTTMSDQEQQESNTKQMGIHQVLENTQNVESIEKSSGESAIPKSEVVSSSQCKTNNFKCRFCPKIFNCEETGVDHMIIEHKAIFSHMKEYKVCDICGKLFISGLSLCKHLVKHYEKGVMWNKLLPTNFSMNDIKGKCWICKTSGVSYSTFHTKSRNSVIDQLLSSEACTASVTDKSDTFHCGLCEETFSDTHKFWSHIKIHLSKSPWEDVEGGQCFSCPRCTHKYSTKTQLLEHVAVHLIQNIHEDGKEELKGSNTFADSDDKMHEDLSKEELQDESDGTKLKTDAAVDNIGSFKCLHCKQVFNIKSDALKHLHSSHRRVLKEIITGKVCHLCDKSFVKPLALCSHISNHYADLGMWEDLVPRDLLSKIDKKYCWICNTVLNTKHSRHLKKRNDFIDRSLSSRSEELEEDEQFQCPLCDFSCSNRYSHWKHIKLHLFLNRKSLSRTDLDSEVEQSTISQDSESKKFECLKCHKQFHEMLHFRKHLATHFLRPCTIKKRKVNYIAPEDKHLAKKRKTMTLRSKSLRLGDGNLRCISCSLTFKNSDDAVSHVLSVHKFKMTQVKENDLSCKMCGANFKSEWWLCRHILNHYNNLEMWDSLVPRDLENALKRNQCWICKCVLDKNYAAHTSKRNAYIGLLLTENCKEEETMFNCSLCNQEFPSRTEYWQHIKLHMCKPPSEYTPQSEPLPKNRKKDYECSDCSLCFQNEGELYKHLALHFLECTDEEKLGTSIMLEEHLSEDTMQTEESSEDEWLPPSIVKKKNAEFKKQEDGKRSDNCQDNMEDNKNVVPDREAACNIETITIDDAGSCSTENM